MTTKVTASLTVQFQGDSASASDGLVLEIDDREDGYNKGETSFRPGDTVYYLLYRAKDVDLDTHFVTAGGKSEVGSGSREVDEVLTFTDSNEASLQYPATSKVHLEWIGKTLITEVKSGAEAVSSSVKVTSLVDMMESTSVAHSIENQQTVRLEKKSVGLLRASYSAAYTAFRLSGVPLDIDQALIYVAGTRP